jgi:hypothetical protein
MKKVLLFLCVSVFSSLLFAGENHGDSHDDEKRHEANILFQKALQENEKLSSGVILGFQSKCMSCHDGFTKNKFAPPIIAVQQVYLRLANKDMQKAKTRMVAFLQAPHKDKTLMKPAVKLYGVMPDLGLSKQEIDAYTKLILETKFTMPDWFNEHFKSHKLQKPKEWNKAL